MKQCLRGSIIRGLRTASRLGFTKDSDVALIVELEIKSADLSSALNRADSREASKLVRSIQPIQLHEQ